MFCFILLAGGKGTRTQREIPKQFCSVKKKPLARHSFDAISAHPKCSSIVVVAPKHYHHLFSSSKPLRFANPGLRRQDSVENGFLVADKNTDYFLIHDAARPFPPIEKIDPLLGQAVAIGAASLALPCCETIVMEGYPAFPREKLWIRQTPQIINKDLLEKGLCFAKEKNIQVTDDLSLVEALGKKTSLLEGSINNIKVTYPIDFLIAEQVKHG